MARDFPLCLGRILLGLLKMDRWSSTGDFEREEIMTRENSWEGKKTIGREVNSSVFPQLTSPGPSKREPIAGWKGFRYAMCNESMQGMKWVEQCELLAKAGYRGIEIAPFSLVRNGIQEMTARKRQAMVSAMKNAGIECVGLHWLLSPPPQGLHVTIPDGKVRARTLEYLQKLIDFCGDLGGKVMVFGSPKGRNAVKGVSVREATKYLVESLTRMAEHAQERGVRILLEPLAQNQTNVVNTTAEAIEIIQEVHHPALQTMFDFHNSVGEKMPFHEIIEKYSSRIYHVHVQEMDGKYLGAGNGRKDFAKAFQTLKDLHYDGWVSLEVFDFSPGPKTIAKESMKALKAIEGKLR
ncbi:MAG TPA: sugar phosphate isomerase/epimerase family protein [Thermodesulfobacteriota bacterium]|nr:sugar phosphate isomerase/epimerase family protein [Thermodesulfobacteriota bacterium]